MAAWSVEVLGKMLEDAAAKKNESPKEFSAWQTTGYG